MNSHVNFDHANPEISGQLFDWGKRLHRESAMAYSEAHGGFWIASRYEDIIAILRNTETFICSERITLPPQKSPVPVIPLESDEPDHAFYRSALASFLTPKAVSQFDGRLRSIVSDALDAIAKRGEGDAVADFAALIPARAMAMIFGFSDDDAFRFDHGFAELVDAAGSGDVVRQTAAVENFRLFLEEKLSEGRADPAKTGLVSTILNYEANGRKFTGAEMLGLMWSAAGGAIDTTKIAISHAVRELGINQSVRQKLIDNPALIPVAVEESLRLNASAFMSSRYVAKNVTLGGADMKAGERVLLSYGLANRDESVFACPHEMKLDRQPNRHLTFGQGIHLCVGMHLAKLEMKIAIEELLARMPDYELVNPDLTPVLSGGMMWGYQSLPIRLPAR